LLKPSRLPSSISEIRLPHSTSSSSPGRDECLHDEFSAFFL
jgi:hypothetical protein